MSQFVFLSDMTKMTTMSVFLLKIAKSYKRAVWLVISVCSLKSHKTGLMSRAKIYGYYALYLVSLLLLKIIVLPTNGSSLSAQGWSKTQTNRAHVGCLLCAALKVTFSSALIFRNHRWKIMFSDIWPWKSTMSNACLWLDLVPLILSDNSFILNTSKVNSV